MMRSINASFIDLMNEKKGMKKKDSQSEKQKCVRERGEKPGQNKKKEKDTNQITTTMTERNNVKL